MAEASRPKKQVWAPAQSARTLPKRVVVKPIAKEDLQPAELDDASIGVSSSESLPVPEPAATDSSRPASGLSTLAALFARPPAPPPPEESDPQTPLGVLESGGQAATQMTVDEVETSAGPPVPMPAVPVPVPGPVPVPEEPRATRTRTKFEEQAQQIETRPTQSPPSLASLRPALSSGGGVPAAVGREVESPLASSKPPSPSRSRPIAVGPRPSPPSPPLPPPPAVRAKKDAEPAPTARSSSSSSVAAGVYDFSRFDFSSLSAGLREEDDD